MTSAASNILFLGKRVNKLQLSRPTYAQKVIMPQAFIRDKMHNPFERVTVTGSLLKH